MDETTKQALNEFVKKMLSAVEQSATWTTEQAPLVVQEWLRWQLIESVALAVGLLLLCAVCVVIIVKVCRSVDDAEDFAPLIAFCGITALTSGVVGVLWAVHAVKVYVAPRVMVLEKFADLIR